MPHAIPGIGGLRKPRPTINQNKKMIQAMTMIHRGEALPEPKVRKERAPSKPYDLKEARLRTDLLDILKPLRRKGLVRFYRIEPFSSGYKGFPDMFLFGVQKQIGIFVELKSEIGVISREQQEFAELCGLCGVRHLFARSVADVMGVLI